jgi:hypothetical protein
LPDSGKIENMKANESFLKRIEIVKQLSQVPVERLNEIESFVKFILFQGNIKSPIKKKEPETLAGIWKNKGFEKIKDLDGEIKSLRKELDNQILERHR